MTLARAEGAWIGIRVGHSLEFCRFETIVEDRRYSAISVEEKIYQANREAFDRINIVDPVLIDVCPAGDVVPGLEDRMILHSGPPVDWEHMSGAQKGACIAMALFEEWAFSREEAEHLLSGGEIVLDCNHHHSAVGPMAGTISKSLPVYVVENRAFGNRAYCRLVEDRQQFGAFDEEAIRELRMWRDVWAPSIAKGIRHMGGLELKPLTAAALQMGDELHNRTTAATAMFQNAIVAPMIKAGVAQDDLLSTIEFMNSHELMYMGLVMASSKTAADSARGIPYSSVVTVMSRNGYQVGIQVSGLETEWFVARAPVLDGLFLPGFGPNDAGRDMGDSAIIETVGLGGFLLGIAPGILDLVGGTFEEAMSYTHSMRDITVDVSAEIQIPTLGYKGPAVGIDIRKVVQTGILPVVDTAIAHKHPGHPIIGGGISRPPMECFQDALRAFNERYRSGSQPPD